MRLWLSQGGIGLPNPEYYADKAVEKVYTEVIRSALSSVYSQLDDGKHLLDEDDEDLSITKKKGKKGKKGGKGKSKHPAPAPPTHDFSAIFDFETQLSSVFVDSVTLEDPVLAYNAYNLNELQHSLAPFIDWSDYFSSFSPRAFPHPVIVDAPAFIGNLSKIIEKTSDETLEVYFVWKTVQSLASLIGPRERARKEVTQLHNYLVSPGPAAESCTQDICALHLYVRRAGSTKASAAGARTSAFNHCSTTTVS
jgi:endothelin-converting enzyme